MTTRLSIGMPVHNGDTYIREALETILCQSFRDFELIISDNASSDKTQEICLEYARQDSRIRYHRLETEIGGGRNFNLVLELATADYFMWAAHDDGWEADFARDLVGALDQNPEAVLAFCRFDIIDAQGQIVRTLKTNWARIFSGPKFLQFVNLAIRDDARTQKANHIYGIMRKSALARVGGMALVPGAEAVGEDQQTLLRLLAEGSFIIIDRVLFHYRVRRRATRGDVPVQNYVWQRVFGHLPGHRGNLLCWLKQRNAYYSAMRGTVNQLPMPPVQKLLLRLIFCARQVWAPVRAVPAAVVKEL